jgi:hypothetical protein
MAPAISIVPRSTPPVSRDGSTCKIVGSLVASLAGDVVRSGAVLIL